MSCGYGIGTQMLQYIKCPYCGYERLSKEGQAGKRCDCGNGYTWSTAFYTCSKCDALFFVTDARCSKDGKKFMKVRDYFLNNGENVNMKLVYSRGE